MLKNITLKRKLVISFVTLTIFIIMLSFFTGYSLIKIRNQNTELYVHPFTVSNAVKQSELDIRQLYNIMQELVFNNDGSKTEELIEMVYLVEQDFEQNLEIMNSNYLGDMDDVDLLSTYYYQSKNSRRIVIDFVETGAFEDAGNYMDSVGPSTRSGIFNQTEIINTFAENKAVELRENVNLHTRNYITGTIILGVLLVSITLLGLYTMMKDIYPPIVGLMDTINSHKKGENKNTLILDRNDEIGIVANTLNEMLDSIKTQQELKELSLKLENTKNQELLRITLQSIGEAVISTDLDNRIIEVNQVATELTGYTRNDCIGKHLNDVFNIVHSKTRQKIDDFKTYNESSGKSKERHNIVLISKDKKEYYIAASISSIMDETMEVYGLVVIFRDITDSIKRQQRIEFLSENDVLTKLRNRNYLERKLLELEELETTNIGIFMGDVNGLKIANDAFGHTFGDELLVQIAEILLQSTEGYNATIVRWGGDEFVIVVEDVTEEDLETLYKKIRYNAETFETTSPVGPNISLGYSLKHSTDQNLYQALIRAEDMMYENKLVEKTSNRSKIVSTLENSLYEKSYETEEHALRVAEYSRMIGNELGLQENQINQIELLGKLHDIGKISIDDSILMKNSDLNEVEWSMIHKHPEIGYRIASSLSELTHIAEGILNHHERYDGKGYPRGIKGENIPLASRIIAVADAFDVMTSDRPYKKKMTKLEACEELLKNAGTQFDPNITKIFIDKICELKNIAE